MLIKCSEHLPKEEFLSARLHLLTIPDHPFNALSLHQKLVNMALRERELSWTIPISNLTSVGGENSVDNIISWAFKVPDSLVSEEQAWLAAIFLTWLLTTNYRFLRYRATLALIRILENRSALAARLINEFHDCNDPYVVERVYAAACGVAFRENSRDALEELSQITYDKMFSEDSVPTHILQRDYAQLIMERAFHLKALPEGVDISKCKPIFNSEWPNIITEKEAVELENRDGCYRIKSSVQPESSMHYGDFGRYVMDAKIRNFSNQKHEDVFEKKEGSIDVFQGIIARRYILGRVRQLGWSPEVFENYERGLAHGRMRVDIEANKVERIGKKYQWIGLHEFVGSLSDYYWMVPDFGQEIPQEFSGAWQLIIRDFDPSQPLIDPLDNLDIEDDS